MKPWTRLRGRLTRRPRRARGRSRSRLAVADLLDEALSWITRRRARSLLTALGTLLGVGAFVATLGLTTTAASQISGRFDALKATKVTVHDTEPQAPEPAFPPKAAERAERLAGVKAAGMYWTVTSGKVPVRRTAYRDPRGSNVQSLTVTAATPGTLRAAGAKVSTGRLYDAGHQRRGERVTVLGASAAQRLGVTRLDQQPAVFIDERPFTVIGIVGDVDRKADLLLSVIIPGKTARQVWGGGGGQDARRSMLISTELGAAQQVGRRAPLALRPDAPDRLAAQVPPSPTSLRQGVEGDVHTLFLLLAAVSLVIGTVGIANTTLVSVLERVQEIGLRRALGARKRHIAAQFLTESCLLGSAGGLLGTCGAIIVVVAVSAARQWTAVIDPALVLSAPFVGTLTGLLAGIYPALKAASIAPVDALNR